MTLLRGPNPQVPAAEADPDVLAPVLRDNRVGGDVNIGKNVSVTHYLTRMAHLQPHPVAREGILSREAFEPPNGFDNALRALRHDQEYGVSAGVVVLIADPGTGARTAALRLLDDCLPEDSRIFELFPDWEEPEVSRIPDEECTGYVLNLMGESEPLSAEFRERLAAYAVTARQRGIRLILLAGRHSWGPALAAQPHAPLAVVPVGRPSPAGVTERSLKARPDKADRTAWLHDRDSVFFNLLSFSTAPRAAALLADIIAAADGPKDSHARDRYQGWQEQLQLWFGGDEEKAPPARALRITAAFLDSCPARAVLDAADMLLATPQVAWPAPVGGVLAGADAKKRCTDADIAFREDGTASISEGHPGIEHALLRHVWTTRPQLVPVLTSWLGQISAAGGPAAPHLGQLARSLTVLAESQGPATILALVQDWLGKDSRRGLGVQALDDLAVHQRIGAAVRTSLRSWAKAWTKPHRQEAVAEVCGRQFGQNFTHVALNRLCDILDSAVESGPRDKALNTLRTLLGMPRLTAQTLTALAEWTDITPAQEPPNSSLAFVHLLTIPPPTPDGGKTDPALANGLLAQEGEEGDAVRMLLSQGWRSCWRHPTLRTKAAQALDSWCLAVEAGALPQNPVISVVSVIFDEEANALSDDLDQIIGGRSPLRSQLRRQYAEAIHKVAASASAGEPALPHQ